MLKITLQKVFFSENGKLSFTLRPRWFKVPIDKKEGEKYTKNHVFQKICLYIGSRIQKLFYNRIFLLINNRMGIISIVLLILAYCKIYGFKYAVLESGR